MSKSLSTLTYDPSLEEGARNAIETCLKVKPDERVVIFTDQERLTIGAALTCAVERVGAPVECYVLEDYTTRPSTALPAPIAEGFERSQVGIFCAGAQPGELEMRKAMTAIVNRRHMRHGHMVGVTERIMREGMRADFEYVYRLTEWVRTRAMQAKEIVCKTPGGTDLRATFSKDVPWIPTSGIISTKKWGNLPGGETFTSPITVDGIFVVDGSLGDWLAFKHGDMRANPLAIEIENSRVVKTTCDNAEAKADFDAYIAPDPNGNRVGEYALGTNTAVPDIIGNMLQDEKIPGVHIAFGHPYTEHTGVDWSAKTHIDVVGRDFDIWFDGVPIMEKGRYLTDGEV
ncbi:MAG: aminopeptidase [Planctomycetota bacterium]